MAPGEADGPSRLATNESQGSGAALALRTAGYATLDDPSPNLESSQGARQLIAQQIRRNSKDLLTTQLPFLKDSPQRRQSSPMDLRKSLQQRSPPRTPPRTPTKGSRSVSKISRASRRSTSSLPSSQLSQNSPAPPRGITDEGKPLAHLRRITLAHGKVELLSPREYTFDEDDKSVSELGGPASEYRSSILTTADIPSGGLLPNRHSDPVYDPNVDRICLVDFLATVHQHRGCCRLLFFLLYITTMLMLLLVCISKGPAGTGTKGDLDRVVSRHFVFQDAKRGLLSPTEVSPGVVRLMMHLFERAEMTFLNDTHMAATATRGPWTSRLVAASVVLPQEILIRATCQSVGQTPSDTSCGGKAAVSTAALLEQQGNVPQQLIHSPSTQLSDHLYRLVLFGAPSVSEEELAEHWKRKLEDRLLGVTPQNCSRALFKFEADLLRCLLKMTRVEQVVQNATRLSRKVLDALMKRVLVPLRPQEFAIELLLVSPRISEMFRYTLSFKGMGESQVSLSSSVVPLYNSVIGPFNIPEERSWFLRQDKRPNSNAYLILVLVLAFLMQGFSWVYDFCKRAKAAEAWRQSYRWGRAKHGGWTWTPVSSWSTVGPADNLTEMVQLCTIPEYTRHVETGKKKGHWGRYLAVSLRDFQDFLSNVLRYSLCSWWDAGTLWPLVGFCSTLATLVTMLTMSWIAWQYRVHNDTTPLDYLPKVPLYVKTRCAGLLPGAPCEYDWAKDSLLLWPRFLKDADACHDAHILLYHLMAVGIIIHTVRITEFARFHHGLGLLWRVARAVGSNMNNALGAALLFLVAVSFALSSVATFNPMSAVGLGVGVLSSPLGGGVSGASFLQVLSSVSFVSLPGRYQGWLFGAPGIRHADGAVSHALHASTKNSALVMPKASYDLAKMRFGADFNDGFYSNERLLAAASATAKSKSIISGRSHGLVLGNPKLDDAVFFRILLLSCVVFFVLVLLGNIFISAIGSAYQKAASFEDRWALRRPASCISSLRRILSITCRYIYWFAHRFVEVSQRRLEEGDRVCQEHNAWLQRKRSETRTTQVSDPTTDLQPWYEADQPEIELSRPKSPEHRTPTICDAMASSLLHCLRCGWCSKRWKRRVHPENDEGSTMERMVIEELDLEEGALQDTLQCPEKVFFDIAAEEKQREMFGIVVLPSIVPSPIEFETLSREDRQRLRRTYVARMLNSRVVTALLEWFINPYDDRLVTPPYGGQNLFPELYSPLTGPELELALQRALHDNCSSSESEKPLSRCLAFLCFYIYGGEDVPHGIHRSRDGAIYWNLFDSTETGNDRVHAWDTAPPWSGWGNINRKAAEVDLRLSAHMAEVVVEQQGVLDALEEVIPKIDSIETAETGMLRYQMMIATGENDRQFNTEIIQKQRMHFFPELCGLVDEE